MKPFVGHISNLWVPPEWAPLHIQSTSAITNARYLELSLFRPFSLIPLEFLVTFLIITFGISNPAISNFHYVKQIFRSLQLYYPELLSRTFSSRCLIFKRNSSKTLRFNWRFIFLCSFIIIRTFFLYTIETRCLSSESLKAHSKV